MTKMSRIRLALVFGSALLSCWPCRAEPAQACGGLFCSASAPVNQAAERIIFSKNADQTVTAVVQIQYQGPSEEFAWVLPVPGHSRGERVLGPGVHPTPASEQSAVQLHDRGRRAVQAKCVSKRSSTRRAAPAATGGAGGAGGEEGSTSSPRAPSVPTTTSSSNPTRATRTWATSWSNG